MREDNYYKLFLNELLEAVIDGNAIITYACSSYVKYKLINTVGTPSSQRRVETEEFTTKASLDLETLCRDRDKVRSTYYY